MNLRSTFSSKSLNRDAPSVHYGMAWNEVVMRWIRRDLFPAETVDDGSWTVLIELYLSDCEGEPMMTKDLAQAAWLPDASCLRVLDRLVEAKLIARVKEPADARVTWNRLTEYGRQRMELYFAALLTISRASPRQAEELVFKLMERVGQSAFAWSDEKAGTSGNSRPGSGRDND